MELSETLESSEIVRAQHISTKRRIPTSGAPGIADVLSLSPLLYLHYLLGVTHPAHPKYLEWSASAYMSEAHEIVSDP